MTLSITNLNKTFGEKVIFENFNFEAAPSEMIAIMGSSGSGKTTLLNIIGILDSNYHGEYRYNETDLGKINEKERSHFLRTKIGYLFQNYSLIDDETVSSNLEVALYKRDLNKKEKELLKIEALEKVGIEATYMNKKVFLLSGGEQQRIALARLVLKQSEIILADEPTGNLDEENEKIIMSVLKDFALEGKIVIVVTHNKSLLEYFDRVVEI